MEKQKGLGFLPLPVYPFAPFPRFHRLACFVGVELEEGRAEARDGLVEVVFIHHESQVDAGRALRDERDVDVGASSRDVPPNFGIVGNMTSNVRERTHQKEGAGLSSPFLRLKNRRGRSRVCSRPASPEEKSKRARIASGARRHPNKS